MRVDEEGPERECEQYSIGIQSQGIVSRGT